MLPTIEQVLEKYADTVKVVFKNFPIRRHKFSEKAAAAALAAHSQGKFWAYHDSLFSKDNFGRFSDGLFVEIAKKLGLDPQEFTKKLKDPAILAKIKKDANDGLRANVRGTPTIFINGKRLRNRTFQGFQAKIDKELAALAKKE